MCSRVTPSEAQAALATVARSRGHVIAGIAMPPWYWWGLAVGWIGLGVITDLERPWITFGATLAFGTAHAVAFNLLSGGRRGSGRLSVRAETAGWQASALVIGCLLGLAGVTVAGALLAAADHAHHPVTVASVTVAVAIVLGGPMLMAAIRRNVSRGSRVA